MLSHAPLLLLLAAQAPAPVASLSLDPAANDEPPPWHKRGYGMTITGAVLVGGFAPPLIGWSIALMADARRCHADTGSAECSWGNLGAAIMMPFAAVALVVGTPLLIVGGRRIADWRRWQHAHRVTLRPTLRPASRGLTVGLELRF
jgi:hypothetical protein